MRYLFVLLMLAGCAQTMTLYPRGGGQSLAGDLRTAEKTMTVAIDGESYVGEFIRGKTYGIMFGNVGGRFMSASGTGGTNQYAALLVTSTGKTLRCEFMGGLMETGNGVCQHSDGRVFDLLLKP